ncbi:hypothetical protein EVAR_27263_1 [Eumeta japonica]|uniref:Uncharacterized protein n=1 Tax=Eumeta variegata TaxID=151549 RepID=A0A4C1VYF1_EUMVA|nr:hypothetical protein EVAR_27263_1 [Eumeta japonica]
MPRDLEHKVMGRTRWGFSRQRAWPEARKGNTRGTPAAVNKIADDLWEARSAAERVVCAWNPLSRRFIRRSHHCNKTRKRYQFANPWEPSLYIEVIGDARTGSHRLYHSATLHLVSATWVLDPLLDLLTALATCSRSCALSVFHVTESMWPCCPCSETMLMSVRNGSVIKTSASDEKLSSSILTMTELTNQFLIEIDPKHTFRASEIPYLRMLSPRW